MYRKLALFWVPRWKFKTLPQNTIEAQQIYNSPDYIASEKKDGTLVFGEIQPDRTMRLIARNKSVTGDYIDRTDYAPHITKKRYPSKLVGTKFIAELYHPKGFTETSRILNSTPQHAQELQQTIGKLKLMPFELYSLGKKELTQTTYGLRIDLLADLIRDLKNDFIHKPDYHIRNKGKYADRVKRKGKEGVVLVDKNSPLFGGTWYKDKKRVDYNLRIVGITPGTGKYAGKGIGSFLVEDASGKYTSKVGIGLSDAIRRDALRHPYNYIGRIAKIQALETTRSSLRHPKFLGLETGSSKPDTIKN